MKGKELNLNEIDSESSHTLGGSGEGRVQGRGKCPRRGKWRRCRHFIFFVSYLRGKTRATENTYTWVSM